MFANRRSGTMRLVLIAVFLFFSVNGQIQPSEQLSEVMMLSMKLLDQFRYKFPTMSTSFSDMKKGVQNFYALGLTDEDLVGQGPKIQQIDRMLLTLSPNAVTNAQYSKLISLLGFLNRLRTIFPADPLQFKLSIKKYGNPASMIEAAYPPLYSIIYNLHRR